MTQGQWHRYRDTACIPVSAQRKEQDEHSKYCLTQHGRNTDEPGRSRKIEENECVLNISIRYYNIILIICVLILLYIIISTPSAGVNPAYFSTWHDSRCLLYLGSTIFWWYRQEHQGKNKKKALTVPARRVWGRTQWERNCSESVHVFSRSRSNIYYIYTILILYLYLVHTIISNWHIFLKMIQPIPLLGHYLSTRVNQWFPSSLCKSGIYASLHKLAHRLR